MVCLRVAPDKAGAPCVDLFPQTETETLTFLSGDRCAGAISTIRTRHGVPVRSSGTRVSAAAPSRCPIGSGFVVLNAVYQRAGGGACTEIIPSCCKRISRWGPGVSLAGARSSVSGAQGMRSSSSNRVHLLEGGRAGGIHNPLTILNTPIVRHERGIVILSVDATLPCAALSAASSPTRGEIRGSTDCQYISWAEFKIPIIVHNFRFWSQGRRRAECR